MLSVCFWGVGGIPTEVALLLHCIVVVSGLWNDLVNTDFFLKVSWL